MSTLRNLVIEKRYDPGFTVVCSFSSSRAGIRSMVEVDTYVREDDETISAPFPCSDAERSGIYKSLPLARLTLDQMQRISDRVAHDEQIKRGWRDATSVYNPGQIV